MGTHRLSFTWNVEKGRLDIVADDDGLKFLIKKLSYLSSKPEPDHVHLHTEAWAGYELTEEHHIDGATVNHVKIHKLKSQ